ncbi:WXG100 family type VII secretion target [Paenibacillus lautus]|uniref:WXG100 family type VII secretion target n=1 Tax=Paenibacillus lautus TaxID=1401 RepID=A0A385TJN0_PAELA|nr:WXG100 family type VII secretion target [Paenibacillus lautus]AYB43701.1 WXG100 family type VII secretion target [Paenibacillus lautus]MCI1777497.1 WXG100 family type VII secretion target [Paenibacillus lautus]
MSNRILVTPEQLEQVSAQFAQSGQLSGDMVQRLQRSIHEMEGQWEGMTRERFYGDYQHARTTMLKFVECLQTISTELKQISVKFRSTDEMVNGAAAGGAVAGAGIMAGAATGAGIAAAAGAASKTSGVAAKSSSNPLDAALKGVEVEGSVIKHEENGLFAKAITGSAGASLSEGAHASGAVVEAGYANDHVEGSVSLVKAEVEAAVKDGTLSVGAEATLNKYEGGVNIPLPWTDKELHIGGSASLGVLGASAEVGKSGLKFHIPLGPGASLVGVGGAITVK